MNILLSFLFALALLPATVTVSAAAIELAPQGKPPVTLEDVYLKEGRAWVALEDVLEAVGMEGRWDSVEHRYFIRSRFGEAWLSPGSDALHFPGQTATLAQRPRFIDGRLRVTEEFIINQLPLLAGGSVYYRNLDPTGGMTEAPAEETPLERFFGFLLRSSRPTGGPALRALAIDPGHGGQEVGVIAADGARESRITLALAQQLEKIMKKQGIPAYLSRDQDYALTLEQRLEPARRGDVDAWLLLHAQAALDDRAAGVALFIRPAEAEAAAGDTASPSLQLARALEAALREAGLPVQGIYRSPLVGLGQGNLPTVLVECGYLSQPADRQRLAQTEGQEQLARALAAGVQRFARRGKEQP